MDKKLIPTFILFSILWLIVLFMPISTAENPFTYFGQFKADLSGKLADDGNLLMMLFFQLPMFTIIATTILFILHLMDKDKYKKILLILSWVTAITCIGFSFYIHSVISGDDTNIHPTLAYILVPVFALLTSIALTSQVYINYKYFNKIQSMPERDLITELERLMKLYQAGVINSVELEILKKKAIENDTQTNNTVEIEKKDSIQPLNTISSSSDED